MGEVYENRWPLEIAEGLKYLFVVQGRLFVYTLEAWPACNYEERRNENESSGHRVDHARSFSLFMEL